MVDKITITLLIIAAYFAAVDAVIQTTFPIGGLFNGYHDPNTRKTFENIAAGNTKRAYLGQTIYPSVTDSYSVAMEVCKNTSNGNGVAALIDLRATNGICDNTCLLCNRNNITHLVTGWEPTETLANDLFTFFYHPSPAMISKAFFALIKHLNWDKFTFLYEDENSFIRAQEIINLWPQDLEPILYMKLDPNGDNRETFKYVFKVARMSYHILDCDIANVAHYMEEIIQIENATQYQSFILTSLDAHTLDLSSVPSFIANVSTMHLTAAKDVKWQDIRIEQGLGVKLETALVADALTHLEKAIRYLQSQQAALSDGVEEDKLPDPPAICYQPSKSDYESVAWTLGDDLRKALLNTTTRGFTGNIQFDNEGMRENLRLHYSKLNSASTFSYVGYWDSTKDTIEIEKKVEDRSAMWKSGVIRVLSRPGLPYFQIEKVNGTEEKTGYVVELITKIFERINKNDTQFQVEFYNVKDSKIGDAIEGSNNKKWDGMIGELMEHNAEMAVCDLSITSDRNSVVDFSLPFMMTGISMLFRVEDPPETDMFSFVNPLSLDVWLYLATTYIIVSFILLICSRMSQDDWVNPHPCNENPESYQNIWSLYNCMWLTMGTIMTQGCDILPRGLGSRWVTGMWYFFAMIITASYTANMSTFLSNSRRSSDIQTAKQLSEQNKVMPGAAYNSSTYYFFKNSQEPVYQKIYTMMSTAKPPVFTKGNAEGKDRVLRGKNKYVFFMESTAIEYYTERNCDLMMVGPELDSKEYGIAMPRNFPHKDKVDKALLQLQESGELTSLKNRWWNEVGVKERCKKSDDSGGSDALQMKNTSGIFLVLGVGALLGVITAVFGFIMDARQISINEKVSFKEALASEWRASLNPRALHKPVAPPRSAPPSASLSPQRERSQSRAVSVLRAASSFINFDEIY